MADYLEILRVQRRGIGTFLVHPEDDVVPEIIGKIGYVDNIFNWTDEEGNSSPQFDVIYEGVDLFFLMNESDGIFYPDPPMTFQRNVQLLIEEDRYVRSLSETKE